MKKMILAGLLVAMASAFAPTTASADLLAFRTNAVTNPYDANAQMRDRSSYGSPSAGQMRPGMRGRSMMRNRMMMRRGMMRNNRMMMRRSMRDPSSFGSPTARRAR